MSRKCKAYSKLTDGSEPEGFKEGFYAGWDAYEEAAREVLEIYIKGVSILDGEQTNLGSSPK